MRNTLLNLQKKSFALIAFMITSITLGQNLYDSSGSLIWDATANSTYNANVSLIGRDDAISLNNKQNTISLPKVGLGNIATSNAANTSTFATDKTYLVWGDNGNSMVDSGNDVVITFAGAGVTTYVDIPNKKWKALETGGDVAITKISIATTAFSSLPALAGNDAYVMIVASDAAFTSNIETVFLTTSGLNQLGDYDFDGTKYFTFGVAHESKYSRHATFDGSDEVIKFDAVNNLTNNFTMMFWIRPTGQNLLGNERTIASKYNGTTGYRIYLGTDNKLNIAWSGGNTLTSATALPISQWHNIAILYSANAIKLYIDGVLDSTVASVAPTINTNVFSIGAEYRNKSDIRNFFIGDLDEFRLWDKALSLTSIKFMINQEILQNGVNTQSNVIPATITKNDIRNLKWINLVAYYSMNSFIGTHVNDDSAKNNRGSLFSQDNVNLAIQTAPMPYESLADGPWTNTTTWKSSSVPNSTSIVNNTTLITWNIVATSHNVSSAANKTLIGLLVTNNTLTVDNDTRIQLSHYLKLDGKIDLVAKSQLVQINGSDLDVTSSGSIEKDQQGQSNQYNYNYWSSPVSSINNSTINHGFTVAGVMKDGTTSTPQNLNWTAGINGTPTTPITLSSYWIFKFQELGGGTANWNAAGETGTILSGQGFTLKGCGAASLNQNYTFVGKPNNGTITSTISPNNLNLTGNPYPSAIDANKFINDNLSSITGTLYFWEHYSTNSSHYTIEYQGGYATYTKTGGTAPVAPSGVSGLGSSRKTPKKYIPVGQGFFVTGSATGGTITYKNSQRAFVKENSSSSYSLFKTDIIGSDEEDSDEEESFTDTQFKKIHIGFDSADNYHRQILLGFMNQYATSAFDNGYDALSIETLSNDMYFLNNDTRLNILGEGYFDMNNTYPIGVKNAVAGIVKFGIDTRENIDENQDIFIYDNVTDEYHNIKSEKFGIELPAGTYDHRFSLRFFDSSTLGTDQNAIQNGIIVTHSQANNMINIKNELQESNIESILLFNLIGQSVATWKLESQNQSDLHLPVSNLSAGTYIVKVNTDKGATNKKIVVN
jgi:hypothetical protein